MLYCMDNIFWEWLINEMAKYDAFSWYFTLPVADDNIEVEKAS